MEDETVQQAEPAVSENFEPTPLQASTPITTSPEPQNRTFVIVAVVIGVLIFVLAGWYAYSLFGTSEEETPEPTPDTMTEKQDEDLTTNQPANMEITISLLGDEYKKGYTFPASNGVDYSAESYEWVKGAETVENWKTLITTHKLSPLSVSTPLSAEAYAQNVAAAMTANGAVIIEASVINNEDAAQSGIDISNPPYLLVYAFFPGDRSTPAELNMQKIVNLNDGSVGAFIYAEKIQVGPEEELPTISLEKREAVIRAEFPY